ncbi:hypothetical protein Nepgr_009527 [Nepenthes gracilis]|uniref:Uncharacterized protein n=1 Tax=Nepenthes gracilis TaxID=150966 RepID=A0AAD3SAZ7_NEPGR|nr:hypothetical protein Nepgr_009527 [Nepenthes gracilis]
MDPGPDEHHPTARQQQRRQLLWAFKQFSNHVKKTPSSGHEFTATENTSGVTEIFPLGNSVNLHDKVP